MGEPRVVDTRHGRLVHGTSQAVFLFACVCVCVCACVGVGVIFPPIPRPFPRPNSFRAAAWRQRCRPAWKKCVDSVVNLVQGKARGRTCSLSHRLLECCLPLFLNQVKCTLLVVTGRQAFPWCLDCGTECRLRGCW